jgi:hypothetical protein
VIVVVSTAPKRYAAAKTMAAPPNLLGESDSLNSTPAKKGEELRRKTCEQTGSPAPDGERVYRLGSHKVEEFGTFASCSARKLRMRRQCQDKPNDLYQLCAAPMDSLAGQDEGASRFAIGGGFRKRPQGHRSC